MFRRTLLTFATRLLLALLNFGTVVLTARYLGAAGRGHVSLLLTDVALVLLFIGLLGGSSLIYLAPRRGLLRLLVPATAWAVLVCATGAGVVGVVRGTGAAYAGQVFGIGLVQALVSITSSLLLGRRREGWFNGLNLLQAALVVAALALLLGGLGLRRLEVFYWTQYIAYGITLAISVLLLMRLPEAPAHRALTRRALRRITRELARHSRSAHLSNILVFFNYRLGYYALAYVSGPAAVGVLSVGVALVEALWLIGRAAAQPQYVDLIHAPDKTARLPALWRAARLTGLATTAGLAGLLLVPAPWLAALFGPAFGAARPVMAVLAPGALAVGLQIVLSAWYSGIGHYRTNNGAALAGLAVNVPACALLVPHFGALGAAGASALAYVTSLSYLLWHLWRDTGYAPTALLPRWAELRALLRPGTAITEGR